jgi:hypothetical protein
MGRPREVAASPIRSSIRRRDEPGLGKDWGRGGGGEVEIWSVHVRWPDVLFRANVRNPGGGASGDSSESSGCQSSSESSIESSSGSSSSPRTSRRWLTVASAEPGTWGWRTPT